jgi:hypothetical protein
MHRSVNVVLTLLKSNSHFCFSQFFNFDYLKLFCYMMKSVTFYNTFARWFCQFKTYEAFWVFFWHIPTFKLLRQKCSLERDEMTDGDKKSFSFVSYLVYLFRIFLVKSKFFFLTNTVSSWSLCSWLLVKYWTENCFKFC